MGTTIPPETADIVMTRSVPPPVLPAWVDVLETWYTDSFDSDSDMPHMGSERFQTDGNMANMISSRVRGTDGLVHKPVLDIDLPCVLLDSSTPGHHHLIINKPMPWETYVKLLDALAEAGVVEKGYANAAKFRGATFIRKPGVRK